MLIKLGFDIAFRLSGPTPMILMLFVHPSRRHDLRTEERLMVEPDLPVKFFTDMFGNACGRVFPSGDSVRFALETLIEDSGKPDREVLDVPQHEVQNLPDEVLSFLLPSRYCEVDKLSDTAWKLFGSTEPGWSRARAICDWVHEHVTFGYQFADPTKTALDVYTDGKGVCRDINHLAVTFCRCMNIPARYCTGYLSDIGTPQPWAVGDFAGWFEAYIGGRWQMFDPRNNVPRIGRVLIAQGRDASDVPITQTFGPNTLVSFKVWTDEVA
jgi:transglutaminase-like putative cysteine protease